MKTDEMLSLDKMEKYETNPFMVELKGKMFLQPRANSIIAKGENIINTETGEVLREATLIGRRKIVDKSQFAKIYASEIAVLYELSKSGQNVFLYLTKVMDYENKSFFNYVSQYDRLGYKTHLSALKGIRELIQRNIIAPAIMPHWYWLNPTIVCKGERFAKYTEYLTEEEAKREQEYLMKQQGKKFIDNLPENLETKFKLAGDKNSIDSNNNELPPMENLPFDDNNPYN
ncbi:hypothetical protein RIU45_11195 [Riemerella anatipestifer]|uniref:hypothetical protein n=1 Tax=Riemerella anatipestifer TaxID=34085 RepID=UPI00286663DC|nr:hypothetical protein [Riemerella anatipestifer]MDR7795521.1 hypothetical protein [Riemerella anatipestifer]